MSVHESKGGPAFPFNIPENKHNDSMTYFGMSLRDYFAAAALQGELSAAERDYYRQSSNYTNLAKFAYRSADAMLAERDK